MAKLYFYYGAMGSSKTANAIMVAYNYKERGQEVIIVKPDFENRSGSNITSRTGLSLPCINFTDLKKQLNCINAVPDVIIIDEVQFLNTDDIDYLGSVVDNMGIPILCYGLRTDFKSNLFEGSKRLMEIADEINEIKTMCWCGHKATMTARVIDGKVVRDGNQVEIGANEMYVSLCRKHHKEGRIHGY